MGKGDVPVGPSGWVSIQHWRKFRQGPYLLTEFRLLKVIHFSEVIYVNVICLSRDRGATLA